MMRLLGFLALLGLGCGSTLSNAVQDFESGRPAEAKSLLASLEPELVQLGRAERARYALYRGLTLLTLGDVRQADRWLTQAKLDNDQDLQLLSAAERGQLLAAWRTIGRMPGDPASR